MEVTYTVSDTNRTAVKIETESLDDCSEIAPPSGPLLRSRGLIEALPSGSLFGAWTISGATYIARPGVTVFQRGYGTFAVGRCVQLAYFLDGSNRVAARLQSMPPPVCRGKDKEFESYGLIRALPTSADLTGPWLIGGRTFEVTSRTKLEDGPFVVGMLVKVKFTNSDGALVALSIEGKRLVDGLLLGKAYGLIDSLPTTADLTGTWVIGGTSYVVTSTTRLRPEAGPFQANACVVVYYRTATDGARTALRITTTSADDCEKGADTRPLNRTYGFVIHPLSAERHRLCRLQTPTRAQPICT